MLCAYETRVKAVVTIGLWQGVSRGAVGDGRTSKGDEKSSEEAEAHERTKAAEQDDKERE